VRRSSVLVLGTQDSLYLEKFLINLGLTPVLCRQTQEAQEKLRHNHFAAVLLDHDYYESDVLELILNIQDIDSEVPILIIGKSQKVKNKDLLVSLGRIYLVNTDGSKEQLDKGLLKILRNLSSQQQTE